MNAAAAVLPPRAAAVAKTPTVTAMAGVQTTINNQLNAPMATATETATTMTMEMKATAAAEAQRQHLGGGSQLGGGGGSLARARGDGSAAEVVAARQWRGQHCEGFAARNIVPCIVPIPSYT